MPFLITLLAGFSTLIGYLFIYIKNTNNRALIISLGFASGVMFYISLFDLLPIGYSLINKYYSISFSLILLCVFILIGIIIASLINKTSVADNYYDPYLYHIGIISMIAIIIHNIPEGIATYLTSTFNMKMGITLAIALALHNIPEGISISVPIYFSTNSKRKAFIYTFISGISETFGAIIACAFLRKFTSSLFMGSLYLVISGIMIYISLFDLFPSSLKYNRRFLTAFSFVLGVVFIAISISLLE